MSHAVPRRHGPLPSSIMTTHHVLAAIGHFADDHRSLGIFEADSARDALDRCLAEHDRDPDLGGAPAEVAELAREEHRQLRGQLHESGRMLHCHAGRS
jgi:hypothetical protein